MPKKEKTTKKSKKSESKIDIKYDTIKKIIETKNTDFPFVFDYSSENLARVFKFSKASGINPAFYPQLMPEFVDYPIVSKSLIIDKNFDSIQEDVIIDYENEPIEIVFSDSFLINQTEPLEKTNVNNDMDDGIKDSSIIIDSFRFVESPGFVDNLEKIKDEKYFIPTLDDVNPIINPIFEPKSFYIGNANNSVQSLDLYSPENENSSFLLVGTLLPTCVQHLFGSICPGLEEVPTIQIYRLANCDNRGAENIEIHSLCIFKKCVLKAQWIHWTKEPVFAVLFADNTFEFFVMPKTPEDASKGVILSPINNIEIVGHHMRSFDVAKETNYLIIGSDEGNVFIYYLDDDLEGRTILSTKVDQCPVTTVSIDPKGENIAVGTWDGNFYAGNILLPDFWFRETYRDTIHHCYSSPICMGTLYSFADGSIIKFGGGTESYKTHNGPCRSFSFSPYLWYLVSVAEDGKVIGQQKWMFKATKAFAYSGINFFNVYRSNKTIIQEENSNNDSVIDDEDEEEEQKKWYIDYKYSLLKNTTDIREDKKKRNLIPPSIKYNDEILSPASLRVVCVGDTKETAHITVVGGKNGIILVFSTLLLEN
eukprot:TRINITY_DN1999_c0_g1_i1.p1 TRINITY_DN1999_c0_g1~~TRINITY_DN1999_c0_g1_i1.p1  ORF type:complete len:593 (-),score=158.43 TRINITY_DN1999_c0_g1_i1:134-1912(-)